MAPCPYIADARQSCQYEQEFKRMMICPHFQHCTLASFQPSPLTQNIYHYLLDWVDHYQAHQRGLYIYGEVGSGKTHLAVGILLELYHRYQITGYFIEAVSLLTEVRKNFHRAPQQQNHALELAKEAPVLVLDDLTACRRDVNGGLPEWARECLQQLINYRYKYNLTTIVTGTCEPMDLRNFIRQDNASRLLEMCQIVHDRASDYRMNSLRIIS